MLGILRPKKYVDSIFEIDFETLFKKGYRGIIFDLDNTIVPWDENKLDENTKLLIEKIKTLGFQVIILSNNWSHKRVKHFSKIMRLPAVGSAFKPRVGAFKKALEIMNTTPETTLVIGDRILTDIFGGNKLGMYTILVAPINKNEIWIKRWTVRKLENWLIKFWLKRGELTKGE
ncbi:MAG: YqeG family HAD IIIA-type phosphatase [Dictyoglomus sp.]